MSGSEGRTCPECGAPRGPDRSPSCDCTERAAEALRETRTAEAAAAEDFDPLRIRPYVEIEGAEETRPVPPVEATLPLRPVPGPSTAGPRMPEGAGAAEPVGGDEVPRRRRRRSGRAVLLSVAGVGAAVVAAAGFAGGLFSYDAPSSRDRSAQEVRASVPDVSTPESAPPTTAGSAPVSRSLTRSPSTPPSPTASTAPSPSLATPSPRPSRPATASPSSTVSAGPRTTPAAVPVLRRGDKGPEVTELQERLRQLNLYSDEINGVFTRSVEDAVRTYQLARGLIGDPYGEYGPTTRKSLETETTAP
ncbi:peptidoglycan-binding domain-containing protein [Streptomyces sp. MMG1121]|uniref:peptidoglycan-binding domain-containing protein n=1 Tax=Streptomyces sp. MMG1121 TaxID=1415544 RepID=UPI0006AF652E|nr:peptidoglycan-binding domain-containing protein [Streptomyces sp. MMG1121]